MTKAVIVAGALLCGFFYLRDNPKPLTDTRPKVATLPERELGYRLTNLIEFFPLSAREVLLFTSPSAPRALEAVDQMSTIPRHAFRIDLKTGKVTRDRGIEKAVSDWPWHNYSLSPDRQSLLCTPLDWKHPGRILDLKSRKARSVALPPRTGAAWFPDSRSVAAFFYPTLGTQRMELVRFGRAETDPTSASPIQMPMESPPTKVLQQPSYIRPDGTIVALFSYQWTLDHPWRQVIETQEFRKKGNAWVIQPLSRFEPPKLMIFDDVVRFSPDGSRILWHGLEQTTMRQKTWKLYTSKPDGTDLRRVGVAPVIGEEDPSIEPPPPSLEEDDDRPLPPMFGAEWMPDGKTICVVVNGGFYLVEDR